MRTVYLCGPIHGKTDAECANWRSEATHLLDGRFRVIDPVKWDYRGKEQQHASEIVRDDLDRVRESDILLVNAAVPGWGTAMEVYQARMWGKYVITFGAPENPSPWLSVHAHCLTGDLGEACSFLRSLYYY